MGHPIQTWANALEKRAMRRRKNRQFRDVHQDEHLARDIGLPHRPRKTGGVILTPPW